MARCARCGQPLPSQANGRPARYCSAACRQAAYRRRRLAGDLDNFIAHIRNAGSAEDAANQEADKIAQLGPAIFHNTNR